MNKAKTCKAMLGALGASVLLTAGLATTAFAAEAVTTMATTAPLNLRDASSLNGAVIDVMPQGASVPVYGMTDSGWYHVKYQDKEGFCYFQYLNFEGTQEGTVHDGKTTTMYATAPLNVRAQPNTESAILGSLAVDEGVPVVAKHDGWFTVNYQGQDAYCYGGYLGFGQGGYTPDAESTAGKNTMNSLVTTAPLNVRTAPGMDARIIGSFAAGETVNVLAMEGDWYKVKFGDTTGYSHIDYLK
ncbi:MULTISPECIES: SH3 domain-containing protein [Gordonibacter]|uniref:SH3 domain-containing protein n=1 Tax=Gordonibacter faecis TaxID=3047475 RepID=A0ABT7DLR5_9ACTN|nr:MULTISPECIES: SH3 domain-containing protein [unclassified Gordonibacter]MDJ1650466.1 SH3 domain-containing protein [Gordonibacter sp. KGMB12511]HIW77392.1 SH3 domain-containing protein [Candidatus Gordonibacter avicola]